MAVDKQAKYQAVIVIHGTGEQKPMEVIRDFVDSVLEKPESGEKYYNKPDTISESLELRVLQEKRGKMSDAKLPRAQFFEYYWAYKMKGTTLGNFFAWAKTLMIRKPHTVPLHLRTTWWLIWVLLIVALIAVAATVVLLFIFKRPLLSALGPIVTFVSGFIGSWLVNHAGDAARYFNPSARNIEMRRDIRADGIRLLRELHNDKYKRYERIVVVGHSLGSVIGYDILKSFWEECRQVYQNPSEALSKSLVEAMDKVKNLGEELKSEYKKNPSNADTQKVANFQNAQHELWRRMRKMGNPWLVTDFITMGSPLAHASIMLAKDDDEFRTRIKQRELPSCPPVLDELTNTYHYQFYTTFKDGDQKINLEVLHSGAPFACTRWTNFYYPGDIAGGACSPWFGPGIREFKAEVNKRNPLARWWAGVRSHGSYWRDNEEYTSLPELRGTIDLKGKHTAINSY